MNQEVQNATAIQLLYDEADSILQLLKNQETLCLSCPVVEEIIDTKMYGFSEKVNFAIDLNIVDKAQGHRHHRPRRRPVLPRCHEGSR